MSISWFLLMQDIFIICKIKLKLLQSCDNMVKC